MCVLVRLLAPTHRVEVHEGVRHLRRGLRGQRVLGGACERTRMVACTVTVSQR